MNELFGAQMSDVLVVIVALLIVIAVVIAALALRNPLLFKLGIRNLPRRRSQTTLIVLGLTISTLIIATAFTVGDTLASSLRNTAFEITGPIDHVIFFDTDAGRAVTQREAVMPQEVADDLAAEFADDEHIAHFIRVLFDAVAIQNVTKAQSDPNLFLLGLDPAEVDALGGIPARGGGDIRLGELQAGKIILNESAANAIAAEVGDRVQLRVLGREEPFEVFAIAEDTLLSGKVDISEPAGAVIDLRHAQEVLEQPNLLSGVGVTLDVTLRDGTAAGLKFSDDVDRRLNAFLEQRALAEVDGEIAPADRIYADAQGRPNFESDPFKADTVDDAETFGSIFTTFFLAMGLFSIAAGTLLIFLVFVMLAEERKTELGISRAIGMQRGQLVQSFLAEGLAYDLGAALVGTAAGILLAFGMVQVLDAAFDDFGFTFTPHVEPRSVAIAAGIGIVLTFLTVVIAAFRVSQLNISAAIRDIPESGPIRRRRISVPGMLTTTIGLVLVSTLWIPVLNAIAGFLVLNVPGLGGAIRRRGWGEWTVITTWRLMRWRQEWWFTFLAFGLVLVASGLDSESAFLYLGGLSLLPIGLLLLARRLGRAGRIAHSLMGALILFFWLAPFDWHSAVTGRETEGDIEMFVLSGIMMVTSATVLVIVNLDLLAATLRAPARLFGRFAPVAQTAAAYPTTMRFRTGMTVAMIAIIMFALVTFTTINANFSRAFTSDVATGGFDVQSDATLNDDVADLRAELQAAGAGDIAGNLASVGRLRIASALGTDVVTLTTQRFDSLDDDLVLDGSGNPIVDPVAEGDDLFGARLAFLTGADAAFLRDNEVRLQARAFGFDSDEAVWRALQDGDERYAVVTALAVEEDGGFGDLDDESFQMPDTIDAASERIPRVRVELQNGGRSLDATIIGVVDQVVGVTQPAFPFVASIIVSDALFDQLYDGADLTRHLSRVGDGVDPLETAQAIEATLRIETVSITDELEDQQSTFRAILRLFQGFTGLGLLAGIAALGVISVRAVVERRQHIGVLRAIGYRRGLIGLELMLEMGFIATLGIGMGITLALALAWRLFDEGVFGSIGGLAFYVPAGQIAIFAAAALLATLIMTYLPARQAARTTIAEALRYE